MAPTYDYVCDACGERDEAFQRISEDPLTTCNHCHAPTLRRLIGGGAAIIFRGSGFYETDYKRTKTKKRSEEKTTTPEPAAKPSRHNPDTPYAKPPKKPNG